MMYYELFNAAAEQAVLSALCFGRAELKTDFAVFSPSDFYVSEVRECFTAAKGLYLSGKEVDLSGIFQIVSTAARELISLLSDSYLTDSGYEEHKKQVKDCALRRALDGFCDGLKKKVFEFETDAVEALYFAREEIEKISDGGCGETGAAALASVMPDFFESLSEKQQKKGVPGVATGFSELDLLTGGLLPGNLYVLAARPGMGKSAFASCVAIHAAEQGNPVLFFSLEMDRNLVAQRMTAFYCKIKNSVLKTGSLTFADWEKLSQRGLGRMASLPVFIDDRAGISADEALHSALNVSAALSREQKKIGLIVMDYLQIMQGKGFDRRAVVEDNCRKMKIMAKRLSCPVLLLSQLSRSTESTDDKRPQLWHLRESGSIEQDADLVAFLYRESYYDKDFADGKDTEVIVAKQRDGATGVVHIDFDAPFAAFYNKGFEEPKDYQATMDDLKRIGWEK